MAGFNDFFNAISGQESGGNYGAVNSRTGASGRFQIMPSNIGPWSQKYLGKTISVAQFRSTPALQDQLARAVLSDYYNRYGARGAAAAWYSGNPNSQGNYKRFLSNEPSVGEYVDQVLKRMGGSDAFMPAPGTIPTPKIPSPQDATSTPQDAVQGSPLDNAAVTAIGLDRADGTQTPSGTTLGATQGASGSPSADPMQSALVGFSPPGSGGAPSQGLLANVINAAKGYQGVPYVWGGTGANGLDCSGLVQRVLGQFGIQMPRVSYDQLKMGNRIDPSQLKVGDLVGWGDGHHVALYIGGGQIVEAPRPGLSVRVRTLGDSWDKSQGFFGVDMSKYYR